MKIRKTLVDLFISVSIAAVLLFVIELVLRILYPEKVLEIAQDRKRIENLAYRFHPDYLIALKPNASKQFTRSQENGGAVVTWTTNSDSFRGPELRDDAELRVIVYGDSNVQARFSRLSQTFPVKLQKNLASLSGLDVEVINAGIVGSGPDQALIRFSADVDTYKPDIVVFHIFADNDFGDIVRNRLFDIDAEGELVRTRFAATLDQNLESIYPRLLVTRMAQKVLKLVGVNGTESPAEEHSVDAIVTRWMADSEEEYAIYKQGKPREFSHFADHYDIDIALHPNSESAITKIALLDRVMAKARAIADEKDVKFMVLIQPSSIDLTQNLATNYDYLQRYADYRRDRLTSIIDDICTRHNISRVNLYPIFYNNNPLSLYFRKGNDHWNDAGQKLAARVTADFIYDNFLAEPRPGR